MTETVCKEEKKGGKRLKREYMSFLSISSNISQYAACINVKYADPQQEVVHYLVLSHCIFCSDWAHIIFSFIFCQSAVYFTYITFKSIIKPINFYIQQIFFTSSPDREITKICRFTNSEVDADNMQALNAL